MEINFIPLEYDYFDLQGKNYARIIGRTTDGKRACIVDTCDVFLWAILKGGVSEKKINAICDKIKNIKIESNSRTTEVLKTEVCGKNFLGKKVKALKIFITNYKDGHAIADKIGMKEIQCRRGYDLGFISHYIIEKKLEPLNWYKITGKIVVGEEFGGISNIDVDLCLQVEKIEKLEKQQTGKDKEFSPKILAFDIECEELEIGKGEILMISLVGRNLKKVFTWKKCSTAQSFVQCFKDEAEMIEAFVKAISEEKPDLLVGYYSDGFDMPYLRSRAIQNKIRLSLGLNNSQPRFSGGRRPSARINGIVHIDLFRFIETVFSQYMQSETLSLNEVSSELLGEKKIDFDYVRKSEKIKEYEWKDYFAYNLQDSVLTYKLTEKIWPDLMEFSRTVKEPLFEMSRTGMAGNVENYILHNLNKFNEIPEKKPIHDEISKRRQRERFEGAFVFQPIAALYEDLAIFDFTSMYGSVIVSFNLSRATFLEKKEPHSIEVDLGKQKVYFSKKTGFFSDMITELIKKRKYYKKELKNKPNPLIKARSNAFKLLVNAAYGYQSFFGARYYCLEAGASTAALARQFIKQMIDKTNKAGYKVIYADTDGFAFLLNKKTKKQALEFLEQLNSRLPGIMELELEEFYKRGIWVTKRTGEFGAKKKYALITESGKLKIRGFETVRRDWCKIARQLQNIVLKKILTEGNEKSALEYFKKIAEDLRTRNIDKRDILIRTQLKKPLSEYKAVTPHVVAARKIKEQGKPVDAGMLIEYFVAETREKKFLVREKVKLPDEKGEYNIKYYLERQLVPAVENIFQVFNINLKEITDGKKQKKLGEF